MFVAKSGLAMITFVIKILFIMGVCMNSYVVFVICCNDICGENSSTIFQFPLKLVLSLFFFLLLSLIFLNNLLLQLFYFIITLFAGMFGYSTGFLCELFDDDNTLLASVLIILFPIPMAIGIGKAFQEIFV